MGAEKSRSTWLVQDSIAYLDDWLNNDMKGFEFGSVAQLSGLQKGFRFIFQLKVIINGIKNQFRLTKRISRKRSVK